MAGPTAQSHNRLNETISKLRIENDSLKETLRNSTRPKYTIRTDAIRPKTDKIRVLAIGDLHDSPELPDKSRGEWIGAHANKLKPDMIVQIGDFMTGDSVSRHVENGTIEGKTKPRWTDDISSFRLMLDAINSRLNFNSEKHCTEGNHERRCYLFENSHPEIEGTMSTDLHLAFSDRGWTHSPYGEIYYIGGVGFVHAALNRLGKTYGGKTAEQTIANDSVHDLVIGHSHVERIQRAPKIGRRHVSILNLGCALPDGHVEQYAQHALTGWSYGIMEITIQNGSIQDRRWITMAELQERYG